MTIPMPNQTQIESAIRWLLTTGGPAAAWLNSQGVSQTQTSQIMTVALAVVPPLISFVWSQFRSTDKQNVAAVAAMPDEAKAAAVAKLPEDQQSRLAAALPDKAVVAAAGAMQGVEVKVSADAPAGAQEAAADRSVPGVNPA